MTESAHNEIQQQIGDLVKRELFEVNELRELEERLKAIAEKASKFTPLPTMQTKQDI